MDRSPPHPGWLEPIISENRRPPCPTGLPTVPAGHGVRPSASHRRHCLVIELGEIAVAV